MQVGQKVMEGCCKTLKPVVLELGGKDPFVVCDDADVERLLPFVMKGSFFNVGQNCIGIERVYVYEKVRARFFGCNVDRSSGVLGCCIVRWQTFAKRVEYRRPLGVASGCCVALVERATSRS